MNPLSPIEFAINTALSQDEVTQARLVTFEGYAIAIDIVDVKQTLYLSFHGKTLQITSLLDYPAQLRLSGNALDLLALSRDPSGLFSPEIQLYGDVQFAKQLQDVLAEFEFDWEQQLAVVTGDTLAFPIAQGVRRFKAWIHESHQSMQLNMAEYLKEEVRVLPDISEVRQFLTNVDKLRADSDRIEAKIHRFLEQQK